MCVCASTLNCVRHSFVCLAATSSDAMDSNGHGSPASAATTATAAVVATCKPVEQCLIYSLVATG